MSLPTTGLILVFAGNDIDVTRSVPNVPATQTLTKAWLTIKTNKTDADPGLVQKIITSASVSGTGQITDTGASGTGALLFQLTNANTLALPVDTKVYYDIQVLTSASKVYTVDEGYYMASQRITTATS